MALAVGARLGPYEIQSALGAGGMGEVYRARDTKLGRDVALKILPESFTHDPERLARFRREAQVLAALNHPHIGAIYGSDEANGQQFLVLELIDGETLADRLKRGALPLDEALAIARQIAEALEAAHEKGIIHRDLKPANIALTKDGTVKVLDFGLAKATEAGGVTSRDLANSPTITSPAMMTGIGVILGTAAYMAPEQAKGHVADKRADMWAFGCVLYEMLTGNRAFVGDDVSETLAAVIRGDPDWRALPGGTPVPIRRLLRRCLTKERKWRVADASIARIEIDEAQSRAPSENEVVQSAPRRGERLVLISAVTLATLIAVVTSLLLLRRAVPPLDEVRLDITTPPSTEPVSLAISPDGQRIVFVATSQGRSRLSLRSLDSSSVRELTGTDRASYPFWSHDGRSIGFFADGKLKVIDVDSGSVRTVASAPSGQGGTWNRDNVILFAPNISSQIWRVSASGGEPAAVTRMQPPQTAHRYPQFLPDGGRFFYYVTGSSEVRGVYVGQISASESRRLFESEAAAVYASSGHLLFVSQGMLLAQRFDPGRLALTGNPLSVAGQVASDWRGRVALSASAAGPIVYRAGSTLVARQFVWLDRSGKELEKVGEPDSTIALSPSISPDGRLVAMHRLVDGNADIWLLEAGRGVRRRFTFDPANDIWPVWSPDGSRIIFSSNRTGQYDLYEKRVTRAGSDELVLSTPQTKIAVDWSPDGRLILYRTTDPKTGRDLWALPLDGNRQPFPVVQTEFEEPYGQFSPDGHWIAYESNKSGRPEIYVQAFPGPGAESQISTSGGAQVRWQRDGKGLFYIALDGQFMAVPIRFTRDDHSIETGAAVPLFATHVGGALQPESGPQYMVSPDGQRFLMNALREETSTSPITVILNWAGALKK